MPLVVPAITPPIVEPPPVRPITEPHPVGEKLYITWTPAGGKERILAGGGFTSGIMLGHPAILGADMPPESQFESQLGGANDGELRTSRRALAREVTLQVVLVANTLTELEGLRRQLVADFDPRRGDGVLTVAMPNGERRRLTCCYREGLESAANGRTIWGSHSLYQLVLRAQDPYWYGDEQVISFRPPEDYQFFAPPGDPAVFYISSSNTTGDADVTIDGEVETWPVAVIGGQCSTSTLRNRDTGKTLTLTPGLTAASHRLTIRMDPRTPPLQKFTRENGNSVWASVAGQFPVTWSLRPGLNRVTVSLAGTVPGQSFCEFRYRPRYLTA